MWLHELLYHHGNIHDDCVPLHLFFTYLRLPIRQQHFAITTLEITFKQLPYDFKFDFMLDVHASILVNNARVDDLPLVSGVNVNKFVRHNLKSASTEVDIMLPLKYYTHVIAFTLHSTDDQFQLDDSLESACLKFVDDRSDNELFWYANKVRFLFLTY